MNLGPNTIIQLNSGGYRASVNPEGLIPRPIGVTINWALVPAVGGQNAQGTIVVTAVTGNITYTYGGQVTGNVAYDATAATIEAALEGLSTIGNGNIRIAGTAPNFTYELIDGLAKTPRLTFTSTGATIAATQAGIADADETLGGGYIVSVGKKVLRAGTVIYDTGSQVFGPASDVTSLVRGSCYVTDRHYFEDSDLNQLGEVYEAGTFYRTRLRIGGTSQPSEANFLTAFPGIRLQRG